MIRRTSSRTTYLTHKISHRSEFTIILYKNQNLMGYFTCIALGNEQVS